MIAKERAKRIRFKLRQNANGRIRLCVFKSLQHFSVQAIDDAKGVTIASAGTNSKSFQEAAKDAKLAKSTCSQKAEWVGKAIAKKLDELGVRAVYLDRGACAYHGVIKAFAEAARSEKLEF